MNKNVLILVFLLVAVAAVGAGVFLKKGNNTTPQSDPSKTENSAKESKGKGLGPIAVIPKGTTHSFWNSVLAGAQKAAKEHDVEILWAGPDREGDREKQIQIVEDFIVRKVAGIVLAPTDARALVPVVERAAAAKIPVVIIDSDIETDKRVSFVATDNYAGGALAAKHMANILGGKGKVAVIKYMAGSASTSARENGFIETVKKGFPEIELVEDRYGMDTVETALSATEDVLTRHKELDGIFACNESTSRGALRALESQGRAAAVKMIGFDAADALLKGLEDGHIDALVVQNPQAMGYKGVSSAVAAINGQSVKARIDTGVELVTKDRLNLPEIQALIGREG
ncbi:MAG: substrate-binding domain-containing protein [Candidatus Pacebacteria bacterium]|nr:substrate-binding domain-containing protein [Candidatus Paceibacterota bacterium]